MKKKELEDLKKAKTLKQIIALHIHNKIFLTDKQLEELLDERNENKSNIILT